MYRDKTIGSVVNDALSKCQALKRHAPMSLLVWSYVYAIY